MSPSRENAGQSERWLSLAANLTSPELTHQCRWSNANLKESLGTPTGSVTGPEKAGDCRSFWMQDWIRRQRHPQSSFCETPDGEEAESQTQMLQQNACSWHEVFSPSEQRPYVVPPLRCQAQWTVRGQERSVYLFASSGVRSTMSDNDQQHCDYATPALMTMKQGLNEQGNGTKTLTGCLYYPLLTTEPEIASKNLQFSACAPNEVSRLSQHGQLNTPFPREGSPNRIETESPFQKSLISDNYAGGGVPCQFRIVPGDNTTLNPDCHGLPTPSTFTDSTLLDWPVAEPVYTETFPWMLDQPSGDEQDNDRIKMPHMTTQDGEAGLSPLYSDQYSPHSLFSSNMYNTPETTLAPSETELSTTIDQAYIPAFPSPEDAGRSSYVLDQSSSAFFMEQTTTTTTTTSTMAADRKPDDETQNHRQQTGVKPIPHRSRSRDAFLIQCKRRGMSYKDIKKIGGFEEAESTLRGRFRTLTKRKELRVRKPQWQEKDVRAKNLTELDAQN